MPKRRSRILPFALGASSLAFTAGAIAFKLSGDGYYDRAEAATTQAMLDSNYEAANTRRHIAIGLGGAAIACATAAVYFYVQYRSEHRPSSIAWIPIASPQQAGMALVKHW